MDAPRGTDPAWPKIGAATAVVLAVALFLAVTALRFGDSNVGDSEGILFILPIGLLALRFGLRGGLAGALSGFALTLAWDSHHDHAALTWLGFVNRGIAFLSLGVLLGLFIDRRRGLEAQLQHYHAVSLETQLRAQRQLANSARSLEEKVAERTFELDDARAETLQLLAAAVEYRDDETSEHTERVGALAAEVASRMGLRGEQLKRLREAAALHDVGKIAIPDRILLKRGNLTPEEHDAMEAHAALGAQLLSRSSSPILQMAAVIAATHHEWWNGTGYPSGLAGERIPMVGRIVAVADVFDALTHERPYKAAWPVSQAVARIKRGSGSQFDPRVVAAFLSLHEELRAPAAAAPAPVDPARASAATSLASIAGSAPRERVLTLIPAGVTANEREPVRSINP